jgi:hypothetical protein
MERFFQTAKRQVPPFRANFHPSVQNQSTFQLIYHQPLLSREPLMVDGKVVERRAYSMFKDLQRRYHWVLPTYAYTDQAHLLATLQEQVIAPAEQKAQELAKQ